MAKPKYTSSDTASTIVVMRGLAMTAGSKPIFFATIGRMQPISLAEITVTTSVQQMVAATGIVRRSSRRSLTKLQAANVMLQRAATRSSFQITLKRSRKWISSSDRPRIMVSEVC